MDLEIERVARMLCRAHGYDPDGSMAKEDYATGSWGSEPAWNIYRTRAANMVVQATLIAELIPDTGKSLVEMQVMAIALAGNNS